MKSNEFEKILEKFEMKNMKDFSVNYLETSTFGETSSSHEIKVVTPIDQTLLAKIKVSDRLEYEEKVSILKKAQNGWKNIPAPQRGELIRLFGDELRKSKLELAKLVSIESGKILQ